MSDLVRNINRKSYAGGSDAYIILFFLLYGLVSQYFVLSAIAGLVLVILVRLLWKPFIPPVLLVFIGFHWVQVFATVLFADFVGNTLDNLFESSDVEYLLFITFAQLVIYALVLSRFVFGKNAFGASLDKLKAAALQLNIQNVIIGYLISSLIIPVLSRVVSVNSSLFQLIASLDILKSIFVGLIVFILFLRDTKYKRLLAGILVFDFVMSFASFFSDFKIVIFIIILVYFTVNPTLKKKVVYRMLPVSVALVIFLSFWSYVKGGYRAFLNQGSRQQVKLVSNSDALQYLFDELKGFDISSLQFGGGALLSRVQYMQRYAEVYKRVPSVIEFQEGNDLSSALEFLLVPRFINANKGVKDASKRTNYYTGRTFANAKKGTSISMGYFCDLYIDFGLYLMIIPLALIAVLIGYLYDKIITIKKFNLLFVYSMLIGTFLALGTFESDMVFFLGTIRNNIAFLVLGYFTFFPALNKFVLQKK